MGKLVNILLGVVALTLRFHFNILIVGILYLIEIDFYFPAFIGTHPQLAAGIGAIIAYVVDRWSLKFWRMLFRSANKT